MIVDYNDPQFKRGLEVGLSCGISSVEVGGSGGDISFLTYGVLSLEVDVIIVSYKIIYI